MSTNRFQFSDDFVLKNGKVGINTAEPQEKLEVIGTIIADNIKASDISNLHTYEGFLKSNHDIDENLTLSSDTTTSLSGEIIVGDDATVTIGEEATSSQGNIDSLKVYNTFTVPTGGTEDRPVKVKPGQLYYNVDFKTIEFWDGERWRQVDNTTRSGRGVFGSNGTYGYVNIHTLGNAEYFGDAVSGTEIRAAFGSSTRGVWGGGYNVTGIEYVTIASAGNAISFGNLTAQYFRNTGGCSSSTRGLFYGGGLPTYYNVIEYVEINTLGNSLDFGDQTNSSAVKTCFSSPTRGFSIGGYNGSFGAGLVSTIDVVTISSKGDAIEFGDITERKIGMFGLSNSVRGVFGGGYNTDNINSINSEYITMTSNGNGIDFGDLTQGRIYPGGTASQTRGIIFGGQLVPGGPSPLNTIDYITIATTGNAQDFGDHIESQTRMRGTSDSHGGLGGF